MPLVFPSSPAVDQTFTGAGLTWKYDGQKWVSAGNSDEPSGVRYQEGLWTPGVSQGDVSFTDAGWTRVGNKITVWCANMTFTNTTSTQPLEVLGFSMPYLCVTPTGTSAAGVCNASNVGREPTAVQLTNGNRFRFSGTASSETDGSLAVRYADIGNSGSLRFTATYLTGDTTWTPQDGTTVTADIQGTGGGSGGGIEEAPIDGNTYGRQDAEWVEIAGGGGESGVRYQQGDWTPTCETGTVDSLGTSWTRTGNRVTISARLTNFSNTTSSAIMKIFGMPYPKAVNDSIGTTGSLMSNKVTYANGFTTSYITADSDPDRLMFYGVGSSAGAGWQSAKHSHLAGSDSGFIFQISYLTDDTTWEPENSATKTEDIQGTGGGGGGSGADAWLSSSSAGDIQGSFNIAEVSKISDGVYTVLFTTPMPDPSYCVTAAASGAGRIITIGSRTTGGFVVTQTNSSTDNPTSGAFYVAVHASAGGDGGSGTTVNYNGASAWGSVDINGNLQNGLNVSESGVSRPSTGTYDVTFTTPLSTSDYAVVVTANQPTNESMGRYTTVVSKSASGFTVKIRYTNSAGSSQSANNAFSFIVQEANAIAPQSGVGADSWINADGTGVSLGSFNATVSRKSGSATGAYTVTFVTPMPNADYSVSVSQNDSRNTIGVNNPTSNGFEVLIRDSNGNLVDKRFSAVVHASSTITPTYTWTRDGTTLKPANDGDNVEVDGAVSALNTPTAWVNFAGANGALRGSFNVNGPVTRLAEGRYRIVFATAMNNADYCVQVSSNQLSTIIDDLSTTHVDVSVFDSGGSRIDTTIVCATIYGGV